MSRTSGHLILIAPGQSTPWKARFGSIAVFTASLALVAPLLLFGLMGYTYPSPINDADRLRLEAENHALRNENKNLELRVQKLSTKLDSLEEMSVGIVGMLGAD